MLKFSKETWLGIIRQGLTFIAGFVALKGWLAEDMTVLLSSGIISIATTVFSWNSSDKKSITDQIQGIVRHLATMLGGLGVLKGWLDADTMIAIGGGLATIIGTVWSVLKKQPMAIPAEYDGVGDVPEGGNPDEDQ
jgi:hypothetical protein